MKKALSILIFFVMVFCGFSVLNVSAESAKKNTDRNILVVYFSCTGNTKGIAEYTADHLGADLYEIVPEVPYTAADLNYNADCRANREQNDAAARPEISGRIDNIKDYDTVFIGYPIWWGIEPRIIDTFIESYDFSDKLIVPFCTSVGSGIESSVTNLRKMIAGSAVCNDGRRFSGNASKNNVIEWIDSIGLSFENEDNVLGDANSDGKINVRDAAFIASKLAQNKAGDLPKTADYNKDGKVNVRDAAAIAKHLAVNDPTDRTRLSA